jgi:hypothetical protein
MGNARRRFSVSGKLVRPVTAALLMLLVMRGSPAARTAGGGQRALVQQVTRLDDEAVAAYSAGDFDKMKRALTKALAIGRDELSDQPVMARIYLHLGVMYVDGLNNREAGVKYFSKARTARTDIALPPSMATKAVASAFAESKQSDGRGADHPPGVAEPARASARVSAAAPPSSNRCPGERELTDVKRQARDELDRLEKALGMSKDALTKERADGEKSRKEKIDLEHVVAELKQRVGQLEKETAQKDKLAAATAQRERKQRDATDALEKEKTEKDSLILETAQRAQDLERESAAKDKLLAASVQREKKERDTREKLEHELDVATARDRERRAWEASARVERDKLEAAPPVPAHIPEPVHCPMPEEIQAGVDLFVRCIMQPSVKAKTLVFYYRPPESLVYNAVIMDPTKRGWSRAVITANKVSGKALQYYVEARDGRDSVAASNGTAGSPNVASIASSSSSSR